MQREHHFQATRTLTTYHRAASQLGHAGSQALPTPPSNTILSSSMEAGAQAKGTMSF